MSLLSLKKSTSSASKPSECDLDAFIDGALLYARGQLPLEGMETEDLNGSAPEDKRYRRATFTLSESAIHRLGHLSNQTGIAKSRLIRIWLAGVDDTEGFLLSRVP